MVWHLFKLKATKSVTCLKIPSAKPYVCQGLEGQLWKEMLPTAVVKRKSSPGKARAVFSPLGWILREIKLEMFHEISMGKRTATGNSASHTVLIGEGVGRVISIMGMRYPRAIDMKKTTHTGKTKSKAQNKIYPPPTDTLTVRQFKKYNKSLSQKLQ